MMQSAWSCRASSSPAVKGAEMNPPFSNMTGGSDPWPAAGRKLSGWVGAETESRTFSSIISVWPLRWRRVTEDHKGSWRSWMASHNTWTSLKLVCESEQGCECFNRVPPSSQKLRLLRITFNNKMFLLSTVSTVRKRIRATERVNKRELIFFIILIQFNMGRKLEFWL